MSSLLAGWDAEASHTAGSGRVWSRQSVQWTQQKGFSDILYESESINPAAESQMSRIPINVTDTTIAGQAAIFPPCHLIFFPWPKL